ncbi:MAG: radical SAM protein, partial [Candidatus Omnitrophota bacterium]
MQNTEPLLLRGILDGKAAFCGPQIAQVDITGKCNNNCIGCWVHSPYIKKPPRDKNKELSFEFTKKIIDELAGMGTKEIFLAGSGEPLLHPQATQVISLIKGKDLKLNIVTNALLLTPETAHLLVDLGVDMLTVSIWAGTDRAYIKTHPGKNSQDFYAIKNNLCLVNKLKLEKNVFLPKVKIYNVICNLNYRDISKMIDFALDVGAQDIEFQLIDTIKGQTSFLALSDSQINEVKDQILALSKREDLFFKDLSLFGNIKEKELKEFPGRFYRMPPGFSLSESIKIKPDNTKLPLRSLTCKAGFSTECREDSPLVEETNNLMIFSFSKENCKSCKFFGLSCEVNSQHKFSVRYLKIMGYGSFMHRLTSPGVGEQKYEKGVINNYPCYTGWWYSRILSTGEIIPCCKGAGRILGSLSKKSLFSENSFASIWNSRAYQKFRFKAKNVSKGRRYFKKINCAKSCDHISSNVMLAAVLKNNNYAIKKTKVKKTKSLLKTREIIKVPAGSFFRGNLNAAEHQFGKGIVIDGGKGFGLAEYKVFIFEPGDYEIWVYYANDQARAVDLYLDNILVAKKATFSSTGGWNSEFLSWMYLLTVKASEGRHIFKIYVDGLIPHLHSFVFIKSDQLNSELTSNLFSLGMHLNQKPLGNFFSKIKSLRAREFFWKAFKHLYLQKPLSDYLDILGIFDGRKAFKGPFHVQIDLTDYCNNNCLACWCNSPLLEEKKHSDQQKHSLPFELAKELMDNLSEMGTQEIYFSGGGEPFCHPRIMDILAYAKKKGFVCYVNTNFTLLDKDKINKLVDLGVDHLTVSIWAATAEVYAKTHPNKTEGT